MHPLESIPEERRRRAFLVLAAASVALMAALGVEGGPLRTSAAPCGIVSYELAGSRGAADAILASWDPPGRETARGNLILDFVFLIAYSSAIGLGALLAGDRHRAAGRLRLAMLALPLAWGATAAGALDAAENVALLADLSGSTRFAWPEIARLAAIPKFVLVAAGILYALPAFLRPRP